MRKLFLLISVLTLSLVANATTPELTKSTPLTLNTSTEGFEVSSNGSVDGDNWISWTASTIDQGYAKWTVNIVDPGAYAVTLDMQSTNTYKYRTRIVNPSTTAVEAESFSEHADRHTTEGEKPNQTIIPYVNSALDGGTLKFVAKEAGEYEIEVTNVVQHSAGKLHGITLSYAGGTTITIPANSLTGPNAVLDKTGSKYMERTSEGYLKSHDNSDPTSEFAYWHVHATRDGQMAVTIRVELDPERVAQSKNPSDHQYYVVLYSDLNTAALDTAREAKRDDTGNLTLSPILIPEAGDYYIKVVNQTQWSTAILSNISFEYAGGSLQELSTSITPKILPFDDVILSDRAWVDKTGEVDSLLFTARGDEGYNTSQWAKWRISTEGHGFYNFTLNAYNGVLSSAQCYKLSVLAANNVDTISKIKSSWTNTNHELSATLKNVELEKGIYYVAVENTVWGSKGRILSVMAHYEGGDTINIPENTLLGKDAVLTSQKVYHAENGDIQFNDYGNTLPEYAEWNIKATEPGKMTVTVLTEDGDVATKHHNYRIELYSGNSLSSYSEELESAETSAYIRTEGNITLTGKLTIPAVGNYKLRLINRSAWSKTTVQGITLTEFASILHESAANDDEIDAINDSQEHDVRLDRSFRSGMYNTICLPFAVNASEMARVFPGAKLKQLESSSIEGENDFVLNLNFTDAATIAAGVPYLIWPAADVTNPKFIGVTIDKTLHPTNTARAKFVGNFIADEIEASEDNLFLGADNTLYFPLNNTPILGMRAYFQVHAPAGVSIRRARINDGKGQSTDIDLIGEQEQQNIIKAQKVLQNGQIFIIRDGVKYNALGIRIE